MAGRHHLPRRRRRDHLGRRAHPRVGGDARRRRPAVRLAGRHVADQLPAAVARRADAREAAVDRRRATRRHARSPASAGLPVFSSVAEYESSLVGTDDDVRPAGGRPGEAAEVAAVAAAAEVARTDDVAPLPDRTAGVRRDAGAGRPRGHGRDRRRRRGHRHRPARPSREHPPRSSARPCAPRCRVGAPSRIGGPPNRRPAPTGPPAPVATVRGAGRGRSRTPWLVGGAILALALLIGGVGAYLLLPSATIVVTPRPEPVGPIHLTVVADPHATAPDATPRVVPAEEVTIPVAVDDTFPATGKRVEVTKATGTVRFENLDPTRYEPDRCRERRAHGVRRPVPHERDRHRAASRARRAADLPGTRERQGHGRRRRPGRQRRRRHDRDRARAARSRSSSR